MKSRADMVRAWLRKAQSDLDNAQVCLASGKALDTVCFHALDAAMTIRRFVMERLPDDAKA